MARLYSRKKGKSGSTKPLSKANPSWLRYDEKEVEQLVLKLSKQGFTKSQIGLMLRDTYGIPSVSNILKKKIGKVLEENKVVHALPEDMLALIRKEISLMKHFESNKKDMSAKRGLRLTESKINRLVKYYKKKGTLDKAWKYDRDKAKLLIS
ncbi:30S ribosomal protein S15 [Candidatus Woesearchaeota archaeon]|nr:30S ribosomal protein S15 [Candidatus Woesearchaeota archaeon]